jgi:hypothetical protein
MHLLKKGAGARPAPAGLAPAQPDNREGLPLLFEKIRENLQK